MHLRWMSEEGAYTSVKGRGFWCYLLMIKLSAIGLLQDKNNYQIKSNTID